MNHARRKVATLAAVCLSLAPVGARGQSAPPSVYEVGASDQPAYGSPASGAAQQLAVAPVTPVTPNGMGVTTVGGQSLMPPQAGPSPMNGVAPAAAGVPGAPQAPAPPFQLSPVEQQQVFQTLQMWEAESAKIERYNAKFTRLEYDAVFGPGAEKEFVRSEGSLSYSKPDKGSFKIDEIARYEKVDPKNTAEDAPKDYVLKKEEVGEHWVCDGKAVYEYDERNKQLVVTPIPEEMRGKSIVDGPLPFLFGAEARKLDARYLIRIKSSSAEMIHLEAYPRWQADAANYDKVDVMLDRKTMQPSAIRVYLPGGQQNHVYVFSDATVNGKLDAWFGGLFSSPRTPIGWKKVVAEVPQETPPGTNPQSAAAPSGMPR